jgi:hypothetical protein
LSLIAFFSSASSIFSEEGSLLYHNQLTTTCQKDCENARPWP